MVEAEDLDGQRTIPLANLPYLPATVVDHTRRTDGLTLETLDPDPETNIELYDDGRAPHRSGETPEWKEE